MERSVARPVGRVKSACYRGSVVDPPFQLPLLVDLGAVVLFSATGAIEGMRKRYDLIGVAVLALVTGLGGSLLRDGIFLQNGPPASLRDGRFLAAVLGGTALGVVFAKGFHRLRLVVAIVDALGLGLYAVYGAQKAMLAGLPLLAAMLVGTVNAVGGGLLRDVLAREEPMLFRPGGFYALAAVAGAATFVLLDGLAGRTSHVAAMLGIAVTLVLRFGAIRLGWKTGALSDQPD
jgi:uncharacterized membrane protein YeiH